MKFVEADGEFGGKIRSKYEPLVDLNLGVKGVHSTVWGSFWDPIKGWGYKCCKSHKKDEPFCKPH
jgi:hypothetical protein